MLFEVCKNNCTVFVTEHKECMPTLDKLKSMQDGGYTFKLNNKKITLNKLKEFMERK